MFFYDGPDGPVPNGQPFATVVIKDYPGERSDGLEAGEYRVNIDTGRRRQPETDDPARRAQQSWERHTVLRVPIAHHLTRATIWGRRGP